jgi:hypothetical protein
VAATVEGTGDGCVRAEVLFSYFTPLTKENFIMTTMEIGKELVVLCKQGKNQEAIDLFYSPNVENVEPCSMPGMEQTQTGIAKINGKINGGATTIKSTAAQLRGPIPTATDSSFFQV